MFVLFLRGEGINNREGNGEKRMICILLKYIFCLKRKGEGEFFSQIYVYFIRKREILKLIYLL